MDVALGVLAFWPALALGSFVNVVAARVPLRRSVVHPRSGCMSCGTELAWYDNVPVVSYLALRGRCRSCGARISPLYPAVELATAGLVAGCFLAFGEHHPQLEHSDAVERPRHHGVSLLRAALGDDRVVGCLATIAVLRPQQQHLISGRK